MLSIWRRHNPDKCSFTKRSETKCRCVIWATGTLPNGRKVRESTKLRDWTRAMAVIRQWEVEGEPPKIGERTTIDVWKEAFLQDAKSPSGRNLGSETYRKYVLLFKQLGAFATNKGLRISDATTLAVSSLHGTKLRLYQAKTGEPVYVPIPEQVATALRAVHRRNPQYFFWSGHSKIQGAASVWRKRLAEVFKAAGIKGGHTHRLRDTFAVGLLEKGVSLETVSILLGHQSLKITQKHYSPWVKTKQEALDIEVSRALSA